MVSSTYSVVFLFCLSSSCVPHVVRVSGLSILSAPSVFSNVYLKEAGTTYHSPTPGSTPGFSLFWRGSRCFSISLPYCVFCCCCFVSLYSVSCSQCCLCLWIVHISLPLRFSLTFSVSFPYCVCCCCCFVCLYSVSCSQYCLCLWIVHISLPLRFSLMISVGPPYCVFCCWCCFVCLYSVPCSQCCLRLWIVHIWPPHSLNFVLLSTPKHNWKKGKKNSTNRDVCYCIRMELLIVFE